MNVDDGQGDHTGTRRLVQITQNPEVERSQVRRQENAQNSDSWKQDDQEESSNSTSKMRLVRTATPRTQFQNMKYTIHQYMTKISQFLQKKLGIAAGYSTFSMEALKTKCVDMENVHVFAKKSSHSSWTELFCELGRLHKLRGIQSLFNITPKLILEHSEEFLNVNTIESASLMDETSIVSRSSGPVDKSKSTCLLTFHSMLGKDE